MATSSNIAAAAAMPSGIRTHDPAAASAPAASNSLGETTQELQDNFMRLLLAQMRNQDPLNPTNANEFTGQLAQLNMVRGIESLNDSFAALTQQMQGAQFAERAALIGRQALAAGGAVRLDGQAVPIGLKLDADAGTARVSIRDANGQEVDAIELGPTKAGVVSLQWDGKDSNGGALPSGDYRLSVTARDAAGQPVTAAPLVASAVTSVRRAGSGVEIGLADGRTVPDADVAEWKQ
jgi:flagellar basal-body rod modification protein FlgD